MDQGTKVDFEAELATTASNSAENDGSIDIEEEFVRGDTQIVIDEETEHRKSEPSVDKPDRISTYCEDSLSNRRIVIAGGFLDIALFTANCEQLNFVLETRICHDYFVAVLVTLTLSLILQVLTAGVLFVMGCHVIRNPDDQKRSNILNHMAMGLVALITILNIVTSTFSIKGNVIIKCLK